MQVSLDQAVNGIVEYVELDTLPLMPNGVKKFGAYIAVEGFKRNPTILLKPYEQFLKVAGVLSEDGKIVDVDALSDIVKSAFAKIPTVSAFGFTFEVKDVDKLVSRLGG